MRLPVFGGCRVASSTDEEVACATTAGVPATIAGVENFHSTLNFATFDGPARAIRSGATYANVHSTTYPGGEIRGQIKPGLTLLFGR